jgi:site-specific DNA-methyltransferase (adenine-specific)
MTPPLLDVIEGRATWTTPYGEAFALLRPLPTTSVDAVITDPPYSSGGFARADRMDLATNKCVHHGTKLVRPDFTGDNRDPHASVTW